MATITTRSGKGSALTHTELDNNFSNLNSDKVEASGDTITGNLNFQDNAKAQFGTTNDLQIYHNGSGSFVDDQGTGGLILRGTNLFLRSSTDENYIGAIADGAVTVYHNNVPKLATTSTGVDVTGTVAADGFKAGSASTQTLASTVIRKNNSAIEWGHGNASSGYYGTLGTSHSSGLPYIAWSADADLTNNTFTTRGFKGNVIQSSTAGHLIFGQLTNANASGQSLAERMRIDSSGNLLVGRTSASYSAVDLHVGSTSDSQNGLQIETSTSGHGYVLFGDGTGADAYVGQISYKHGDDYMAFRTAGLEAMRITSNGNVGIGTSSPNSKVEILESVANGEGAELRIINDGTAAGTGQTATLTLGRNFSERNIKIKSVSSADFGNNPELVITQSVSGSHVERMRIDSSGNVGIGTSSPSQKLHLSNAGAVALRATNATNGVQLDMGASTSTVYVGAGTSHPLVFQTGFTERARIDTSGNLLVGKTSSSYTTDGIEAHGSGRFVATHNSSVVGIFDRRTSDGEVVQFRKDGSSVGSIGSRGGAGIVLDTGSFDGAIAKQGTNALFWSGVKLYPATDNAFDLGSSTARFKDLFLSGGAYLGGTAAANKLDDYEEGTFSPTVTDGSTEASYGGRFGRYTKVGRLVHIELYFIDVNTTGLTSGNDIVIGNLPFAHVTQAFNPALLNVRANTIASTNGSVTASIASAATSMKLLDGTSTGIQNELTISAITSGTTDLFVSGTYEAA